MLKDDVKKHVATNCATYAGNGRCHLDRPCPFFNTEDTEMPRCSHFENAVLPADDNLSARYWGSFGLEYWGDQGTTKACTECKRVYKANSNRQKYCDSCREIVQSRQKSAENKRYRKSVK